MGEYSFNVFYQDLKCIHGIDPDARLREILLNELGMNIELDKNEVLKTNFIQNERIDNETLYR